MLSNESVRLGIELASIVADNKVTLKAIPETPLNELVRSSVPAEEILLKKDPSAVDQDLSTYLNEISTHQNGAGVCEHDMALEELQGVLSTAVATALHIARVDVNGMVKRVAEQVKAGVEEFIGQVNNPLSVIPVYRSAVWSNPSLKSMVERYENTAIEDVRTSNMVTEVIDSSKVMTGIGSLDSDIEALLKARPNLVGKVAARLFTGVNGEPSEDSTQLSEVIRYYLDDEELVVGFLLARRFLEETPSTQGVDLESFNAWCTRVKVQLGRAIATGIERQHLRNQRDELVINYPYNSDPSQILADGFRETLEIRVNGEIYVKWLKEGGSPEVLFGALFSDKATKAADLMAKKEGYLANWQRANRLASISKTNKSFVTMQQLMARYLTREINDLDEDELPGLSRQDLHARLKTHIDHMCADDLENLYYTTRHVVCEVMFSHTHAYKILTEMDAVMKREGTADPREAALFTAINYTTDWVADQIEKLTVA